MNANEEPRNAGTFPFARKWNSSVPKPANRSVADTESPVSAGTSTVAPNMANICCRPNTPIFDTPSGRASYTASGLSLAPMVGTGRSLLIGKTPLVSLPRARRRLPAAGARKPSILCYKKGPSNAATGESVLLSRWKAHAARSVWPTARHAEFGRAVRRTAPSRAASCSFSGVGNRRARPPSRLSPLSGSPSPFSRWNRRRRWRARAR